MFPTLITEEELIGSVPAVAGRADLAFLIQTVSDAIHRECDRKRLVLGSVVGERIIPRYHGQMRLREYPIVEDSQTLTQNGIEIDSASYSIDWDNGILTWNRLPIMDCVSSPVIASYEAGYEAIPGELKLACFVAIPALSVQLSILSGLASAAAFGQPGPRIRREVETWKEDYDVKLANSLVSGDSAKSSPFALPPLALALVASFKREQNS